MLCWHEYQEKEPMKLAAEYLKSDLLNTVMLRVELASEKWADEAEGESALTGLFSHACYPRTH